MNASLHRIIVGALLLAAALLATINWALITRPVDTSPIRAALPQSIETRPTLALTDTEISPQAVAEILARPLFNAERRPLTDAASDPEAVADRGQDSQIQSAPLTLVGTLRRGNTHLALIRVESEPLARWVDVGGNIDGWTLKQIDRDFIAVERAGRTFQIPIISRAEPQNPDREAE